MQLDRIALSDTHSFSSFFIDYIEQKQQLKEFYHLFPDIRNFQSQIESKSKSFSSSNREILNKALTNQYGKLKVTPAVSQNLALLAKAETFTVTTGHQLNIFTGPLFFIYKIATVINACKRLKELHPKNNFVPVFWMASEDHDYEEIKSFKLYGKKYTWETNQSGAVGRFNPKSIDKLFNEVPGEIGIFKEAYTKNTTLAGAVRSYVNELFGKEGLVAVDGDDPQLKALFADIVREDLTKHTAKTLVEEKNKKLEALGYHTQVFVRDINLFYLADGVRSRIEKANGEYAVVDTPLKFSEKDLLDQVSSNPERFSPNVILRPLYQEVILPNLAYVGGPAEMIYWLQLKGIFDHHKTPFPILLPRNFAMVMEKPQITKWKKTGLTIEDLFKEKNYLFNHWVLKNTNHDLSLGKELEALEQMTEKVRERATKIDSTLNQLVSAETKRALKSFEKIEKKMLKAEKRVHEEKLKQIEAVKDALFPGGGLQERVDNFLNFYQKDPGFIDKVLSALDPFDFRLNVIGYDEG